MPICLHLSKARTAADCGAPQHRNGITDNTSVNILMTPVTNCQYEMHLPIGQDRGISCFEKAASELTIRRLALSPSKLTRASRRPLRCDRHGAHPLITGAGAAPNGRSLARRNLELFRRKRTVLVSGANWSDAL
jgi:hypothetical protein